jgi:hypothetical protein
VVRSTFGRLFTYARESKADALENFTTEALAAAIREDPRPIVHLLRGMLLLPSEGDPVEVLGSTQVGVPGAGILDLVIDIRYPGTTVEIWSPAASSTTIASIWPRFRPMADLP